MTGQRTPLRAGTACRYRVPVPRAGTSVPRAAVPLADYPKRDQTATIP